MHSWGQRACHQDIAFIGNWYVIAGKYKSVSLVSQGRFFRHGITDGAFVDFWHKGICFLTKGELMEYEKLCQNILEHVGGSDNINQAFHCITRLRLIVKDKSKVDFDALKQVEGVLQVLDAAGQVQVVIGTQVEAVYHEFCEVAGIPEGGGVDVDYDPDKDDEGDILMQTMSGNSDSAKSGRFS